MAIKPIDIEAVQAALIGEVSPAQVAVNYSGIQKVLLAHAALVAGKFGWVKWKGQFGKLLVELVSATTTPKGGWPRDQKGRGKFDDQHLSEYYLIPPANAWVCTAVKPATPWKSCQTMRFAVCSETSVADKQP